MNNMLEEFCGDNLTVYNHNNVGNPHEQYVTNSSEIAIRPYDFTTGNYFKLLTVLLDKNELNNNSQFVISFDVYETCKCRVEDDNRWELLFKIGNASPEINNDNYGLQVKLFGKEKRCIAIIDKVNVEEDNRVDNGDNHNIEKVTKEKIRCELYVLIKNDMRFIKRFLSTNIENKYYAIYNMTHSLAKNAINERLTIEEIEFYKDKLVSTKKDIIENEKNKEIIEIQYKDDEFMLEQNRQWCKNSEIFLNKEKEYCNKMIELSKDENNIVKNKILSRTDDGIISYNIPKINDGINKFIKLFDIDMNYYVSNQDEYSGIFEMFVNYSSEFVNYGYKYVKFIINSYTSFEGESHFSIDMIDKVNVTNDEIFVLKNGNKYSVWYKGLYPSNIKIKPIINNDNNYNIFKLPLIDEFTKFLPKHEQKININERF